VLPAGAVLSVFVLSAGCAVLVEEPPQAMRLAAIAPVRIAAISFFMLTSFFLSIVPNMQGLNAYPL
jgi:hypothetical protein